MTRDPAGEPVRHRLVTALRESEAPATPAQVEVAAGRNAVRLTDDEPTGIRGEARQRAVAFAPRA